MATPAARAVRAGLPTAGAADIRGPLLAWYGPREAAYPWRGPSPDPYRVLVSEVMLQQTQAARVVPVYRAFLRRFPSIRALAAADRGDVLRAWNGLGYNRRAVALSEAARAVVRRPGARIPWDPQELLRLPGVGPYTAAAVASIAFGRPVPAIDTNVRRVLGRFSLGLDPVQVSRSALQEAAEGLIDRGDPGRWNQAMMDLGREVCRPAPRCDRCPLAARCRYRLSGRKGTPPSRRQDPFAGSFRQLRGAVIRALADHDGLSMAALADRTGHPADRVWSAVEALTSEGLIQLSSAALAGKPRGRVWLGEGRSR